MKSVDVTIGGETYSMPITWEASLALNDKVGDPIQMAMAQSEGEVQLTLQRAVEAIWVGIKHAGGDVSREEIFEEMQADNPMDFYRLADEYIASFLAGPKKQGKKQQGQGSRSGGGKSSKTPTSQQ